MRKYNRIEDKAIVRRTVDMEVVDMGTKFFFNAFVLDDWKSVAELMVYDLSDDAKETLGKAVDAVDEISTNYDGRAHCDEIVSVEDFVRRCRAFNECLRELHKAPFPGLAFVKTEWRYFCHTEERTVFLGSFETTEAALEAAKSCFDLNDDRGPDCFRFSFVDGKKPRFI